MNTGADRRQHRPVVDPWLHTSLSQEVDILDYKLLVSVFIIDIISNMPLKPFPAKKTNDGFCYFKNGCSREQAFLRRPDRKKREMADMPPNSKVCGRYAPELLIKWQKCPENFAKNAEMPRFSFFALIKIKLGRSLVH